MRLQDLNINYDVAYFKGVYNWIEQGKNPRGLIPALADACYPTCDNKGWKIAKLIKDKKGGSLNTIYSFVKICDVNFDVMLGCKKCLKANCDCP